MKFEYFKKESTEFDTHQILGGKCTFSLCTSSTNDAQYQCGDTKTVGTEDDGYVYYDVTVGNECTPT